MMRHRWNGLREKPQADDMSWLHLQMQLAFLRGDARKLRSLSETLVKQQGVNRTENAASELARHAWARILSGKVCLRRGSSAAKLKRPVMKVLLDFGLVPRL